MWFGVIFFLSWWKKNSIHTIIITIQIHSQLWWLQTDTQQWLQFIIHLACKIVFYKFWVSIASFYSMTKNHIFFLLWKDATSAQTGCKLLLLWSIFVYIWRQNKHKFPIFLLRSKWLNKCFFFLVLFNFFFCIHFFSCIPFIPLSLSEPLWISVSRWQCRNKEINS